MRGQSDGHYGPGHPFDARQLEVRAALLRLPGSLLCNSPGCLVITQGGHGGMAAHKSIVHGSWRP